MAAATAMDRAERAGLGVAVAGHVALFGILSVGFLATPNPLELKQQPIEVTITDEVGLVSAAPEPVQTEPAPRLAEVQGPVEPIDVAEPEPAPQPVPAPAPAPAARPKPKPTPTKAVAKPVPKPKPTRTVDARERRRPDRAVPKPTGALAGIARGLTDRPSNSRSTTPPAATAGPAVKASLAAEVIRQLKQHWKPPSGPESALLRTKVRVRLARDGSIIGEPAVVSQSGQTESNRGQSALHAERAIKAVKLAAPFKLPTEYYDAWKTISPILYETL